MKLTDFGISKQQKETFEANTFTKSWRVDYMSPERIKQEPYDVKADIWSAGCILYYLCALQHPFAKGGTYAF